jgi:hypothetical protein
MASGKGHGDEHCNDPETAMDAHALPSRSIPWPTAMAELEPAERLVVWSFRRWVTGLHLNDASHWSLVWKEFVRQFGADPGQRALGAFASLVRAIQSHARRRITYHQPCCPCLGPDEALLVSFVFACQHKQWALARSAAEWMVREDGIGDLLGAGGRLGALMRERALVIPDRRERRAAAAAEATPVPAALTVH